MSQQVKDQQKQRRYGLIGVGCTLLPLIPLVMIFLAGVLGALQEGGIEKISEALMIAAFMVPFIGILAVALFNNVSRVRKAQTEIEVLRERMEAQAGSISISVGDTSGAMTEIQENKGALSDSETVFDFEEVEQPASSTVFKK